MITIFAHVKPFTGIFDVIQTNALRSWRALSDEIDIFIFGEVTGAKEIASEINATHINKVETSSSGMPKLNYLFNQSKLLSKYKRLCYINADIILPPNFLIIIESLIKFRRYVGIGNRYDVDYQELIDFNESDWWEKYLHKIKNKGNWHKQGGVDYFIFNHNTYKDMPDIYLGLPGSDNWLIWEARRRRIPVIDLSDSIMVIHQNHDYSHLDGKMASSGNGYNYYLKGSEANHNRNLVNISLNINDANWILDDHKIIKKKSKIFISRNLNKLPYLFPNLSYPIILYKKILRRLGIL